MREKTLDVLLGISGLATMYFGIETLSRYGETLDYLSNFSPLEGARFAETGKSELYVGAGEVGLGVLAVGLAANRLIRRSRRRE